MRNWLQWGVIWRVAAIVALVACFLITAIRLTSYSAACERAGYTATVQQKVPVCLDRNGNRVNP